MKTEHDRRQPISATDYRASDLTQTLKTFTGLNITVKVNLFISWGSDAIIQRKIYSLFYSMNLTF